MADPRFAHDDNGPYAHDDGSQGAWAPEGSPGIQFLRNPAQAEAAAQGPADAATSALAGKSALRSAFGRLGPSDDTMNAAKDAVSSTTSELNRVQDFRRRTGK